MAYHMEVMSTEPESYFNADLRQDIIIEVGCKYVYSVKKPSNEKDRKDNGRIVEVLGFSDSFMGDAIVRYLDNNRRGRLRCGHLIPHNESVITFYNFE